MFRFKIIKHFKHLSKSNHKMISRTTHSSGIIKRFVPEIDKPHISQNVNSFINQGLPLFLNNKQINKIYFNASDLRNKESHIVAEITYIQKEKEIKLRYEDNDINNLINKVYEDLKKGNL